MKTNIQNNMGKYAYNNNSVSIYFFLNLYCKMIYCKMIFPIVKIP